MTPEEQANNWADEILANMMQVSEPEQDYLDFSIPLPPFERFFAQAQEMVEVNGVFVVKPDSRLRWV